MRAVGELIAEVREVLRSMVEPGISTLELNNAAEKLIRDAGAIPTFIGYHGFPFSICASVNDEIVHGFSKDVPLVEGDIVSLDMAATYNGFVGDTAITVPVGRISDELKQLIRVTEECLQLGIEAARVNGRVGDIGFAVQQHADKYGYGIVRDYTGHGIGRNMHEAPQIPNYGRAGTREKIRAGYCFAIEPMLNIGTAETRTLSDKWTVVTADGKPSAHAEHTLAVTPEGPEILTLTKAQKSELAAAAVAPGMLDAHYAPQKSLLVGDITRLAELHSREKLGLISFEKNYKNVSFLAKKVLSPEGSLAMAASRLFEAMRALDQSDVSMILAATFPDEGLGRAINDRLKRASIK